MTAVGRVAKVLSRKALTSNGSRGAPPASEGFVDIPDAASCRVEEVEVGFRGVLLVRRLGDMVKGIRELKI